MNLVLCRTISFAAERCYQEIQQLDRLIPANDNQGETQPDGDDGRDSHEHTFAIRS